MLVEVGGEGVDTKIELVEGLSSKCSPQLYIAKQALLSKLEVYFLKRVT